MAHMLLAEPNPAFSCSESLFGALARGHLRATSKLDPLTQLPTTFGNRATEPFPDSFTTLHAYQELANECRLGYVARLMVSPSVAGIAP
jgi:hypothetical protein